AGLRESCGIEATTGVAYHKRCPLLGETELHLNLAVPCMLLDIGQALLRGSIKGKQALRREGRLISLDMQRNWMSIAAHMFHQFGNCRYESRELACRAQGADRAAHILQSLTSQAFRVVHRLVGLVRPARAQNLGLLK